MAPPPGELAGPEGPTEGDSPTQSFGTARLAASGGAFTVWVTQLG